MKKRLTAIIEREDDLYVAHCPQLDIASQGDNIEQAKTNLVEAIELFYETASDTEISKRQHEDLYITQIEAVVG